MSLPMLTAFFGWATLLNLVGLVLVFLVLTCASGLVTSIHHRFSGLSVDELKSVYFRFLAAYKLVTIAFFLVPYIALRIMGG